MNCEQEEDYIALNDQIFPFCYEMESPRPRITPIFIDLIEKLTDSHTKQNPAKPTHLEARLYHQVDDVVDVDNNGVNIDKNPQKIAKKSEIIKEKQRVDDDDEITYIDEGPRTCPITLKLIEDKKHFILECGHKYHVDVVKYYKWGNWTCGVRNCISGRNPAKLDVIKTKQTLADGFQTFMDDQKVTKAQPIINSTTKHATERAKPTCKDCGRIMKGNHAFDYVYSQELHLEVRKKRCINPE